MAAEVGGDSGSKKKKGKKGRSKKMNPRIDMTPMVDLGFLLLTFFVLTTRMSTPTTMPVIVPADPDPGAEPPPEVSEKKVLNLIISGADRIYHYQGVKDVQLNMTNYAAEGIRKVIQTKAREIAALPDFRDEKDPMIVLIKMTDDAKYRNMVDILDEMNITEQKRYMLIDITKDEVGFILDYEKSQGLSSSIDQTARNMGVTS